MTSFITRVNGDNKTYKIIIDTDEEEKYITIQDFCRALIDHSKPTSNIVEVVRCKDCKNSVCIGERYFCDIQYDEWGQPYVVKSDGYCDCGERRTEDDS